MFCSDLCVEKIAVRRYASGLCDNEVVVYCMQ